MSRRASRTSNLATAARRLAEAAMTATERTQQLDLLSRLARELREVTACPTSARRVHPAQRALAEAIHKLPDGSLQARLADLRLLARLTLPECADLLRMPERSLGAVWQQTKSGLFAHARRRLPRR